MQDVKESYPAGESDCLTLIEQGRVIAVQNKEGTRSSGVVLFPKRLRYLTSLSGEIEAVHNSDRAKTTEDVRKEVRAGDIVVLHLQLHVQ